jgi:hypothetical protein
MDRGYIKLWRKIEDCEVLHERGKVFSKFEAWIFIVMTLANGVDKGDVRRGEFVASYRYMAKAWRWNTAKAYRFIESLIEAKMLEIVKHLLKHQMKHFKVCNYDTYNPSRNADCNTFCNKSKKGIKEYKRNSTSPDGDASPKKSSDDRLKPLKEFIEQEYVRLRSVKLKGIPSKG